MKYIYLTIGSLSLILGVVGIFIPVMPTTPFLLLAAAMFFRSSLSAYNRLLANRYLGKYIRNFRERRAIPLRAKIVSFFTLWGTSLYSTFFVFDTYLWGILMFAVALGVSAYILSLKTAYE